MDALILGTFLSPILTVTTVWNTRETGDIIVDPPKIIIIRLYLSYFQLNIPIIINLCKKKGSI